MTAMPMRIEPSSISIDDDTLEDMYARLRRTRLPESAPSERWQYGVDREYLRDVLAYWVDEFDWRAQERNLNRFANFRAEVDGLGIHFVHARAAGGKGIPLILAHGWPSAFVEYLSLVPMLTDPAANGIDGPAFDLIIPSLPGYGFSDRPRCRTTYRDVAGLLIRLMRGLGYTRYGAGGGDFGAGIATFMALDHPEQLIGLHFTNLELAPYLGAGSRPLSDAERHYVEQARQWEASEGGYTAIQSTKPQTLSYALNDSPAGLAAWILEKWRSWSDCGGNVESRFSRDFLLTIVTMYWATATIGSSMRDYFDNRRWQGEPRLGPGDLVRVPTGVAVFPHTFVPEGDPPREWAERLYNVRRWTEMPRGGHFAPTEEPRLVAQDVAAFFAALER